MHGTIRFHCPTTAQPLNGREQPLVEKTMARLEAQSKSVATLFGLALLSLALCPAGLGAQEKSNTRTCEVHVDLQHEIRPGTVVRTPIGEVNPLVAQVITLPLLWRNCPLWHASAALSLHRAG